MLCVSVLSIIIVRSYACRPGVHVRICVWSPPCYVSALEHMHPVIVSLCNVGYASHSNKKLRMT